MVGDFIGERRLAAEVLNQALKDAGKEPDKKGRVPLYTMQARYFLKAEGVYRQRLLFWLSIAGIEPEAFARRIAKEPWAKRAERCP